MEASAITVVTQFANEGRLRYGELSAIEVAPGLWEELVDEVAAAGGEVGLDYCVVDGVQVRPLAGDDAQAVVIPAGTNRRERLGWEG